MTTLIHAHGAGAGRCDAKCYDAQGADCDCVCGGMNHGAGIEGATESTQELAGDMLREIEKRGGVIPDELRQQRLF